MKKELVYILKKLKKELEILNKAEEQLDNMMNEAPEGKLRCAINKGSYQYYCGKEYLGKDKMDYIKQLAQKEYNIKMKEKLKNYKKNLKSLYNLYSKEELENIYRSQHPGRKSIVNPVIKLPEHIIKEFESIKYENKGFKSEDITEFYTVCGERVRSKSEKIIADTLNGYGVPYKYEMPLQLKYQNRTITFYPDFTVLNKRTAKKYIIEHLGMMDKLNYYENAIQKIDIYEKNNLLIGRDIILFHETHERPLNVNVIRNYIEEYLL